jgi:rubrerythrin
MTQRDESESLTPAGVRIVAVAPGGEQRNVTEGVQALYDLVIQSMDWGSHFLSVDDVEPIAGLARFCGFRDLEAAEAYIRTERQEEARRACNHREWRDEPVTNMPDFVWKVCKQCGYRHVEPQRVWR